MGTVKPKSPEAVALFRCAEWPKRSIFDFFHREPLPAGRASKPCQQSIPRSTWLAQDFGRSTAANEELDLPDAPGSAPGEPNVQDPLPTPGPRRNAGPEIFRGTSD